jgi:hypothetical protein
MLLTLVVVPVFYLTLDDFGDAVKRGTRRLLRREPPSSNGPGAGR